MVMRLDFLVLSLLRDVTGKDGIEVGRDSDNRVVDGSSEVSFCSFLHLEEDHQRDFFG